jgi:Flp pilus assembly protein TadG
MKIWNRFDLLRGERGASLVEMAFTLPIFVIILFGAVDMARAYYLSMEVVGAAHAGALYGFQYPTDTAGIQAAAIADAPDASLTTSNVTVTYGCECSDSSSFSSGCSAVPACTGMTEVNIVKVTVTASYTPMFPWPGTTSKTSLPISSTAAMRNQ